MRLALLLAMALGACAYPYTPPALAPVTQPAGPATGAPGAQERRAAVTILISIDGMRPDQLGRGDTPVLDALAAGGVKAAMRPAFPTLTFPNHYTLVTGLRPDRHGVIDNTMEDARRPGVLFKNTDATQVRDGFWWDGAEPIWVSAERAGIRTGTMFWPGSEAEIGGVRPSNFFAYSADLSSAQRADVVLDWMRRPAATRPGLATLYFDTVDKRSHNVGYLSPAVSVALREIDAAIGSLRDGLAALGQPANLIVVSDHGMAPVPPEHQMPTAPLLDPTDSRAIFSGPMLGIIPLPGHEEAVAKRVLAYRTHARCWRKGDMPARFRFGTHPRVPPLVCLSDIGWRFAQETIPPFLKGDHGWDNAEPSMQALFVASGPAFRPGKQLATFDNTDVYPLIREMIGLPPATGIDGTAAPFRGVLVKGR